MTIVPAIIPKTKEHLLSSLGAVESVVHEVQIDIVDGVFAGEASWPFAEHTSTDETEATLRGITGSFALEVDLMVKDVDVYFDLYARVARRLVIHWGSTARLDELLAQRSSTLKIGIALTNDIPLEEVYPYMSQIDFVQCMGIAEVGVQGNGFDPRVLPRIKEIHETHPALEIAVDGHVTMFTLPLLKDAGATRFMAGSSIFTAPDPAHAFLSLQELANA